MKVKEEAQQIFDKFNEIAFKTGNTSISTSSISNFSVQFINIIIKINSKVLFV